MDKDWPKKLGSPQGWSACPGEHARSKVWKVEGGDYLKVHETGRAFAQELRFYKEAHSAGTPTLLQVFEEKKALLLSGVTGEPTSELAPEERLIAHRHAGQFLRQLHEIPLNDTDIPLNDALLSRLESARKRLGPGVPLEELQELIRQRNLTRNWCHGDFMEHNWLWNGTICKIQYRLVRHSGRK